MQDDLDRVADQLEALSEQLVDLSMSALREALNEHDGDGARPAVEKRISRARRGIDKAAYILRGESMAGMI